MDGGGMVRRGSVVVMAMVRCAALLKGLVWVAVVGLVAVVPGAVGFAGTRVLRGDCGAVAIGRRVRGRGVDVAVNGISRAVNTCGWQMIRKNGDDTKGQERKIVRSRTAALYFRDSDSTDVVPDKPVELIRRPIAPLPVDPSRISPISSNFGESYWLEYFLKVVCDVCEQKSEPVRSLQELEIEHKEGRITSDVFEREKKRAVKEFWASLVSDGTTKRNIKTKEINLQVTNSAQFVDSWIRKRVLDAGEKTIGLAIQWNMRGSKAVQRDRISLVQIAVGSSILIVQMAQLQPPTVPSLLHSILADDRIRKSGSRILSSALKLQKDWGVKVVGRVDVTERAAILGYCADDAPLSDVARSVLALDYAMPRGLTRGDWSVAALTDMQLTCAALEAWVARESLLYMESLTASEFMADKRVASSALAVPDAPSKPPPGPAARLARPWGVLEEAEAEALQPPRRTRRADQEADAVLYLPKVDVRKGGSCAHWIWRGTRVSDQHVAKYCGVEVEADEYPTGGATVVRLWGGEEVVREATQLLGRLLARSQVEGHCLALGMTVPQYIDSETPEGMMQTTALVNQMELVDWSFFPSRLTKQYTSAAYPIRGQRQRRDALRAAFFAQADAAARVADELLGQHRPRLVVGPLPPGLDPGLMWRVSGYTL